MARAMAASRDQLIRRISMRATPDRQAASIEFASRAGRIPLRIAPELHEILAEQAAQEGRSLNSYLT